MGAFISNVHVRLNSDLTGDDYLDILTRFYQRNGWSLTTREEAELTVHTHTTKDGRWMALYTEEMENSPDLEFLTQECARLFSSACIGVLVHDSDALSLYLSDFWHRLEDTFLAGFDGDGAEPETFHPDMWVPVLGSEGSRRLGELAKEPFVFAEEILHKVSSLAGWDSAYASASYSYLEDMGLPTRTLCFRNRLV